MWASALNPLRYVQVVRRDDGAELRPVPGRGAAPLAVQARLDAHAQGPPQRGLRHVQVGAHPEPAPTRNRFNEGTDK